MGINTSNIGEKNKSSPKKTVLTRKEKIAELKKKHQLIFDRLGINDPLFVPKPFFGQEKTCYVFPSEIRLKKDLYSEKVSKSFDPEDEFRTLYVLKFNEGINEKYPIKMFGEDKVLLVPIRDFEEVKVPDRPVKEYFKEPKETKKETVKKPKKSSVKVTNDAMYKDLTIKDYCAIKWKKPISDKDWLNNLIKKEFNLKQ